MAMRTAADSTRQVRFSPDVSPELHTALKMAARLFPPTAFGAFLITLPREDLVAVIGRLAERDGLQAQSRLRLAVAV